MYVYRIEDEAAWGPYADNWGGHPILGAMLEKHNGDLSQFPNDEVDFDFYIDSSLFFGFDSIEAAVRWFGGHFDQLHEAGYHVAVYEIDEDYVQVGRSGKQVVFPLGEAERVQTMPMKKLLDFI